MAENFVKIAKIGTPTVEVCVEDGATLADALEVAKIEIDGMEIRINKRAGKPEDEVFDGDKVILVAKVKGG